MDILEIDFDSYKRWIEFQRTPELKSSNCENDHVKPICLFDVFKDEELRDEFNRKNTQPLIEQVHKQKEPNFISSLIDQKLSKLINSLCQTKRDLTKTSL